MEEVKYKVEDINKIFDYLSKCPYREVAELVGILRNGKVIKKEEEKNEL